MYLFFDTETTGTPRNYKAPISDSGNWPRLVQLAWILYEVNGTIRETGNFIISPDGFEIPEQASAVHGITTEQAKKEGQPLWKVLHHFSMDLKKAEYLIGHNISFDEKIVGAEYFRLGQQNPFEFQRISEVGIDRITSLPKICTMLTSTRYCNIPGKYGPKWPKLQELYSKLFGKEFEDAHDALADIKATAECFYEMIRIGVIKDIDANVRV